MVWALAGFALMWLTVDDLKMHLMGGGLIGQAASLRGQMCLSIPDLVQHVRALATEALPILYGGRRMALAAARMTTMIAAGTWIIGVTVFAALGSMIVRLATTRPAEVQANDDGRGERGFGGYLAWVGAFTACAYPLSCQVVPGAPPLLRYLLLALLLPVGCYAAFMQRERSSRFRAAVTAAFVLWGAVNLADNVRLMAEALRDPPGSEHRALVDYLLQQRIRYARAIYWDAYVVDFLSGERVITASVDVFRIPEYQKIVEEHAASAVNLERLPCEGTRRVASWCVTGP